MGRLPIDMTGIILQARMGSTRLPGKILKMFGNKTLLDHIFFRLSFLKHPTPIVLATSDLAADDLVERFCIKNNVPCFRGSESNVLERYYLCAKKYGFNNVIRMTGDNPFPDIEELDNLIDLFIATYAEYSNSFGALPIGVGAEIFTFSALEESYIKAKEPHHLEHVNEYIQEHPEKFKTTLLSVPQIKNRPELRLTVDTSDDYKRACFIIEKSKNEFITTEEAIDLCSQFA